jgi:HPt (histidine-containing phosphotransfer) domain-containing protein
MDLDSDFSFQLPKEMIQKYISRRYVDLNECLSALEINDFDKIAHLAHQMKGNGTSFGFSKITDICGELEVAAKNEDPSSVKTHLQELGYLLEQAN